jgi:hypothetical protein
MAENVLSATVEDGICDFLQNDRHDNHGAKREAQCRVMQTTNSSARADVASTAARLVVEEGLEYGPAKRRALKLLGLSARSALPPNDELEDAVHGYIVLFCADTQPTELAALRALAAQWMERMAQFRPHLGGAVWHGTATRRSDIHLDLFCDDSKSAELVLIDHRADYETRTATGLRGEPVDVLSVHDFCSGLGEMVGVHLMVYDLDDLRGALKPDAKGRPPRGDLSAVRRLQAAAAP